MKDEYDFSNGVLSKYAESFKQGHNLVLLDPDIAKAFPTTKSVNEALRKLLDTAPNSNKNQNR